jgi:hypothetical protein
MWDRAKHSSNLFGIIVIFIFESVFLFENALKTYLFLFFKIYFWHQHIKTILTIKKKFKAMTNIKKNIFFKRF